MASTPEGKVKSALDRMLKAEEVWYYSPQAGPFGVAGIPDRVAVVMGLFVGIECKAGKGKPTALQVRCMQQIEAAGGVCFVVRDDETIKAVREFIHACRAKGQGVSAETDQP